MKKFTLFTLAIVGSLLLSSTTALAETFTQSKQVGNLNVTVSMDFFNELEIKNLNVKIDRAGVEVYNRKVTHPRCKGGECYPFGGIIKRDNSGDFLVVRNIDTAPEPEIVIGILTAQTLNMFDNYSCCTIVRVLKWNGTTYQQHDLQVQNANMAFLNGSGAKAVIETQDHRFTSLYAPRKYAYLPKRLMQFRNGKFIDVSKSKHHKNVLAADARAALRKANSECRRRGVTNTMSAYAAYAHNQYRLNKRGAALKTLRQAEKKNCFKGGTAKDRRTFIKRLDTKLRSKAFR